MTIKNTKPPQSQASLKDQLDALDRLAAQNGLYDAQDWLRQVRQTLSPCRGTSPVQQTTGALR